MIPLYWLAKTPGPSRRIWSPTGRLILKLSWQCQVIGVLYRRGDADILKAELEFARGRRDGLNKCLEVEKNVLFVKKGHPFRETVLDD